MHLKLIFKINILYENSISEFKKFPNIYWKLLFELSLIRYEECKEGNSLGYSTHFFLDC